MSKNIIDMQSIVKRFYIGTPNELEILHGMSFTVPEGQFVSIVGASGSGKSTLMNIIGALDKPTSGKYLLDGEDIGQLNDKQLSAIRNKKIGFVFQTFNLIARTSALKNVELPMLYAGVPTRERNARAKELLEMVEMTDRAGHMPNELSGGQKQRIAIARALLTDPKILIFDEATSALDYESESIIQQNLKEICKGRTVLIIAHRLSTLKDADLIMVVERGQVAEYGTKEKLIESKGLYYHLLSQQQSVR